MKVKESQERVRKQVALKGPILRLELMWRINKTLTTSDGRLVGRKEELQDKLISRCKRMECPTRAVSVH